MGKFRTVSLSVDDGKYTFKNQKNPGFLQLIKLAVISSTYIALVLIASFEETWYKAVFEGYLVVGKNILFNRSVLQPPLTRSQAAMEMLIPRPVSPSQQWRWRPLTTPCLLYRPLRPPGETWGDLGRPGETRRDACRPLSVVKTPNFRCNCLPPNLIHSMTKESTKKDNYWWWKCPMICYLWTGYSREGGQ